ncbi:glucans biosynthesis protein [Fontimonas thermophila]|uniref:Glucans biosynthesis protein G n=1 Tax=Fontimonas thermophila TaxID=1076937 RepID=A0A1I2KF66_9GAMM|nr:glucan biosynthesis protein G [Fontimonas thermophila]SFF65675.1 glucans biosynthesis protein [Fontimonas thermophila]
MPLTCVLRSCLLAGLVLLVGTPAQAAFDFEDVVRMAQKLAERPYEAPSSKLPSVLANLTYDQYRDIRFRPEKAIWRNTRLPFEIQFLHPGMYYNRTVRVNLISADGVKPIGFDPSWFDYGHTGIDPASMKNLGFAGFRIHYPINRPDYKDEVLVFHGATYFRALGRNQRYGLSARALAVDTAELSGEEFPQFTEFWIEWPRPEDHVLTIYALMDSPRLTGAYAFRLIPGDVTSTEVTARLFFREDVAKLGIAPLTSMYFFGENHPGPREDYRPEVHDSDGLMLRTDNEWIWRPLVNPRRLFITSFGTSDPRGFGLMQRDRLFAHYEDLEARYDLRPSAWVEPRGDWGKGRVELVSIPTPDETNDNIVAYWVPERAPRKGDRIEFEYNLLWQMHPETQPPLARVVQTRRGHGWLKEPDGSLRFHIDFEGGPLADLPADANLVAGVWVGDGGEILERQLYRNEVTGGWRLSLRVRRSDDTKPLEMRAILRNGEQTVSETWAYALPAVAGR